MDAVSIHKSYQDLSLQEKLKVKDLVDEIWPDSIKEDLNIHFPDTIIESFLLYDNHELISYVGILQKEIHFLNQTYTIAALTCVATQNKYRHQGLGLQNIVYATQWIQANPCIDFGVFSCHHELTQFYIQAGWTKENNAIIIANLKDDALSSKKLGLDVLMMFVSQKALDQQNELTHYPINLEFPDGQFI